MENAQAIDEDKLLAGLPAPTREAILRGRAHHTDPNNLDELEALNPEPIEFTVNRRKLVMEELPHVELVRLQARMADLQERLKRLASDPAGFTSSDVKEIDKGTRDLLMALFAQTNPWLDEMDREAYRSAQATEDARANEAGEPARHLDPTTFTGTFFGTLTERKLNALAERAFSAQQGFAAEELAAAQERGLETPFERALRSRGAASTASSPSTTPPSA